MDDRVRDLLKPEVLNSVNGLELVARIVVEGFMTGSNKSQAIGYGQEFSQYRNYEPGLLDPFCHAGYIFFLLLECVNLYSCICFKISESE